MRYRFFCKSNEWDWSPNIFKKDLDGTDPRPPLWFRRWWLIVLQRLDDPYYEEFRDLVRRR